MLENTAEYGPGRDRPLTADRLGRLLLMESVATFANDAILITECADANNSDLRIVYVNPAFERMTGYARIEVLGKSPRLLQGPLSSIETIAKIRSALAAWDKIEVELLNYDRFGRTFWVEMSIVPIVDDAGWVTHWVSIQRDVTARKATTLANHAEFAESQIVNLSLEIDERKKVEARLAYAASHDHLTGLYNRAFFTSRLSDALARARSETSESFALLYFDLDRFKLVNDSLGHGMGDKILQSVALNVLETLGSQCILARMGGDEFAVLFERVLDPAQAIARADALLRALRMPTIVGDLTIVMNASIGVVTSGVDDGRPEDVLRDADIAMYRAKRSGGDCYAVFDETMHVDANDAFRLHGALRRALENDEFVVHYQPIVELATGAVRGFEALVRWEDPERGLISPLDFIGIAEETGAIVPIGKRVLEKGCAAFRQWQSLHPALAAARLSVNVSVVEFRDATFFDTLMQTIVAYGLEPAAIQIEVTESVLLEGLKRTADMLAKIRAAGIRVAIDDFGTGYSSLSYLERFPIDVLKIDRSFVTRMAFGQRNVDIVKTIADLARILDLELLAEGIETEAERSQLVAMGFPSGQGFLFAKPIPEADVAAWLSERVLP